MQQGYQCHNVLMLHCKIAAIQPCNIATMQQQYSNNFINNNKDIKIMSILELIHKITKQYNKATNASIQCINSTFQHCSNMTL